MRALLFISSTIWLSTAVHAAEPAIPPAYAAMMKEHLGSWETTGEFCTDGKCEPMTAKWSCEAAAPSSALYCVWHHFKSDGKPMNTEHEVIGYDAEAGKLRFTRIHEDGTVSSVLIDVDGKWMRRHWEYQKDGKTAVAANDIDTSVGGLWKQRFTSTIDGKVVLEMRATQKRVAQ
jgi:hypothetical protein